VAKILLERALIPSLLYGAGNWIGMDRRTEEECDKLQYLFWRVMFGVPDGTPKIALVAETGTMRMKWRIWEAKILMINRIYKQEQGTLARKVYEEQLCQGWPGLAREVSEICQKVGLPDVNTNVVSKEKITEAVFYNHYKDMKEELKKFSKLDKIKHENYTKEKDYINDRSVDRSRKTFRMRTEMLETFKDNFRAKHRKLAKGQEHEDPGLVCPDCGPDEPHLSTGGGAGGRTARPRDSQVHCTVCPAWEAERQGLDLGSLEDLTTYFRRVLAGRGERKDQERKEARRKEEKRRKQEAKERERQGRRRRG
jgi:hypothetical protein